VFAIAMTLLVVGIGIPHVREAKLGVALEGKDLEIFSFFLRFVVIGVYRLSHHRFFARLQFAPVAVFLLSIPVAFALSPRWALYTWILIFPLEMVVDRRTRPDTLTE
jgi:uncharacterized membrane protein